MVNTNNLSRIGISIMIAFILVIVIWFIRVVLFNDRTHYFRESFVLYLTFFSIATLITYYRLGKQIKK